MVTYVTTSYILDTAPQYGAATVRPFALGFYHGQTHQLLGPALHSRPVAHALLAVPAVKTPCCAHQTTSGHAHAIVMVTVMVTVDRAKQSPQDAHRLMGPIHTQYCRNQRMATPADPCSHGVELLTD